MLQARIIPVLAAFTSALGLVAASSAPQSTQALGEPSPIYGITIPAGYRQWQMISIASVGPPQSDLRVKLGNEIAIRAYQEGTRPFPDGAIIARLAYRQAHSAEGNAVLGAAAAKQGLAPDQVQKFLEQSFVAGAPTNVQFMVKDSKKYAQTGGWGFAQFTNGRPDAEAVQRSCFSCHEPGKDRDFVFTEYVP
jgi:hypothetical protein